MQLGHVNFIQMDTLKEQIMMRKIALNPDQKKGEGGDGQLAQKSYNLTKFAEIMSDDEEDEDSHDDFD